ncbi:MAG TPA: PilZ domain-containing protein [Vicinamibacteria bacterium]|nr:PilZ domain-containing protein [Vicinamibacteria bacterium]
MHASPPKSTTNAGPPRARRLALDLPLRFRVIGETQWHEGRTENISRSGILFRTEDRVFLHARVEMKFVLPIVPVAPAIVCRGRIVRTVRPAGAAHRIGAAATISRYWWRRAPLD